jgi:hypothetical protein
MRSGTKERVTGFRMPGASELRTQRRVQQCPLSLLGSRFRLRGAIYSCLFVGSFAPLLCGLLLFLCAGTSFGQVSAAEVLNPKLKALQGTYFDQLVALNRAIRSTTFPFPFFLSRYVGLDPKQQVEADTRGIEFVKFHDRVVLKITGNYNAAYNADLLTENQRASRTFQDVVVPLLLLTSQQIPSSVACDAVGFEISYHVRRRNRNYDYEGKEILVVVLDKADAFGYLNLPRDSERQEVLNRSEIYVDGNEFGLALAERDPLDVAGLERSDTHPSVSASGSTRPASGANSDVRLAMVFQDSPTVLPEPERLGAAGPSFPPTSTHPRPRVDQPATETAPIQAALPADVDRLQAEYQSKLDALAEEGVANLHFVDYAPPSFVLFRKQVYLQMTLRNPVPFEPASSSIYKRAAQSFDLFLAPKLKTLLDKVPAGVEIAGLDITVLNQLALKSGTSSEALEFVSPLKTLRQFIDADLTNQDLINQSVVLVNGVRIALDLQRVE